MFFIIILMVVASLGLLSMALIPLFLQRAQAWQDKKAKSLEKELDKMFYDKSPKQIVRLYLILPPLLGFAALLLSKSLILVLVGALIGLFIPNMILKLREAKRKMKFNSQILDAIMILSSSLKGGLSLLQAFEVLVEEMGPPMSQEIGLVVRENKMGVTLEDSINRMSEKMKLEELQLVVNSILVARETGGDLTKVFGRLSTTIRDNRKLKDNVKTLTLQGRLQGLIMSFLPILFVIWVMTFNRQHFDIMLQTQVGRMLLFAAVFLQLVGMVLIKKFSTVRI
jgi:tight adherence protein B